ncbi:tandem-95 repeat protein, partial [Sphingomonas parva]
GDGQDTITDTAGVDRIELGAGIAPGDIEIVQLGTTGLVLKIAGGNDRLALVNVLSVTGNIIESVVFADGTNWSAAELRRRATAGTPGDDVYNGTAGVDELSGQGGRDTLSGAAGADILSGGADDDRLDGGADADRLSGGTGKDVLIGGTGGDTYVFAAGDGTDEIDDNGDATIDTVQIDGYSLGQIRFSRVGVDGNDLSIRFSGSADRLIVRGAFAGTAADTIERFAIPASGLTLTLEDVLTRVTADVAATGETLYGTAGDDVLSGGAGDDFLSGDSGADTLSGGDGNDIFGDIVADNSVDTLTGGAGRDTYRFLPTYNVPSDYVADLVTDFQAGDGGDIIRLSSSNPNPFEQGKLRVSQVGTETHILLRDDLGFDRPILRLANVTATSLTAANFDGVPFGIDNSVRTNDGDTGNTLSGGPLDDTIFGNGGADTILGLGGNDRLAGGADADVIDGGFGMDWVAGQEGHDRLLGGAGNDVLAGGSGDDVLIGGDNAGSVNGSDLFEGGLGDDALYGGGLDDVYRFAAGDGRDVVYDAGGQDRIELAAGIAPADVAIVQVDGKHLDLRIGTAGDRIRLAGALAGNGTRIEQLRFADGTTWSWADIVARSMAASAGDDRLQVSAEDGLGTNLLVNGSFESFETNGGTQTWWGWTVPTLAGWTDANGARFELALSGVEGVESSDGSYWLDMDGESRNMDILQTVAGLTAGQSLLLQFDHANRVAADSGGFEVLWNGQVIATFLDTGIAQKTETLLVSAIQGGNVVQFRSLGVTWDSRGASLDNVRLRAVQAELPAPITLQGLAGNDQLTGSFRADVLIGGTGDDRLAGGLGNDTYVFNRGDGQDTIEDADGLNRLVFGAGIAPDQVRLVRGTGRLVLEIVGTGDRIELGAATAASPNLPEVVFADGTLWSAASLLAMARAATSGNDVLYGSEGADLLDGSAGDDLLRGLGGDDQLNGAGGVDRLEGGAGSDVYLFGRGSGQDVIADSAGTADVLQLGPDIATSDVSVEQSRDGSAIVLRIKGTDDRITIEDALGAGRIETIRFADASQWSVSDLFQRFATSGDDMLTGDGSDNVLAGALGNDMLSGGAGDDTYRFARGDGRDTIRDGAASAADRLEISGYGGSEISFLRRGFGSNDLVIRFAGSSDEIVILDGLSGAGAGVETIQLAKDGTTISVANIRDALVASATTDGDDTILGTSAADTIAGGRGNDLLVGDAGDDIYLYRKGDGDDRIDAFGSGADTVRLLDYAASDVVSVLRAGPDSDDVVIRFSGEGDRLVLRDALGGLNAGGNTLTLQFKDGSSWDRSALRARALGDADGSGDDNVYGFDGNDTFAARPGNDLLSGGTGGDTYAFAPGSGHDRIEDRGTAAEPTDKLQFSGFLSTAATVERLFRGSESIVIRFTGAPDDSVTILDALALDGRGIESYGFADGVTWTKDKIRELLDNRAPVAGDDGYFSVTTGQPLLIRAADLLRNDFDADGDPLRIVAVDGGEDGVATFDGDGNIVYTAINGFAGATTLVYTLSDGRHGFAEAGIDVRVRPVATAREDRGFTVQEDNFLTIRVERLLSNDLDGDRMVVGQVYGATNGTVSLASDGNISFTPTANFNGVAEFTYVANTPEGGRAEAKVLIDVVAVNDAPIAVNDGGIAMLEGNTLTIDPAVLLSNDRDPDGDPMSVQSVRSTPDLQVSINSDGTIRIVPRPYFWGAASFEYVVADSAGATAVGRVNLSVTPVNDAPEAHADRFELTQQGEPIREDNPIVITAERLLANDIEHDGEAMTVSAVGGSFGGRARLLENQTVLFEPFADFNGEAWFDYQVSDGHGGVSWSRATIVYQAVNDRPVSRDDHYNNPAFYFLKGREDQPIEIPIIELLKNDFDVEGFLVKFENASNPINGDFQVTDRGTIIFTPDADFWGEASFDYLISDPDGAVDDGRVTLWFENVSDGPPKAERDTIYVYEDVPTVIPISALLGNDVDIDRDPIDFLGWRYADIFDVFRFGGDAGIPINGTLEFDQNGNLLFTPNRDASVSGGLVYRIGDHRDGESEGYVDIVILPSNDDPTAVNDEGYVTPLDIPLVIRVADVMFNDYDVEQADHDGDGVIDDDLDDPKRARPTFVSVDAILDPAELARGNHVALGTVEVVSFEGERFIVARFPEGFSGSVVIQYTIADAEGLQDIGFIEASVADFYAGTLSGTPRVDYILGGAGRDVIRGFASNDLIAGMGGDDRIESGLGADRIDGGDGDDLIDAGDDGDHITGGDGFDTVIFTGSNTGVRADLEARVGQGGFAQGDVYVGIEALIGTEFADILGGDSAANRLEGQLGDDEIEGRGGDDVLIGGGGNDSIDGGAGADRIDGGEGIDTAIYFLSSAGVQISLLAGTATGGDAQGDVLVSIENLVGSDFADSLTGDDRANLLSGGRGDDVLDGGAGDDVLIGGRGADVLIGGEGVDTVNYSLSVEGVTIDLANSAAGSGDAQGDSFTGIEIVEGSYHDDVIRGDDADNRLRGGRGADVIDGRGGFDIADYSTADEAVTVDLALGRGLAGEAAGDTLIGIEMLLGSVHDDTLRGSAGDDVFDGGYGDDALLGGAGSDLYVFDFDSKQDVITEIGDENDIDRIVMGSAIGPKDVSLLRQGDDLFIELERDDGFLIDTIRVTNHFLGAATGIEAISFANGARWDRDRIAEMIRIGRFNAEDDIYRFGVEDETVVIDPATLIRNDAEEGVDKLVLVSVQNGKKGSARIREDGMIEFIPAKDHHGDAFFDYTVRDEFGRESSATVEVNLAPVNDAPTAVDDALIYAEEDKTLRVRIDSLLANDFDIDDDWFDLRITGVEPLKNLAGNELNPYKESGYDPATHITGKVDGDYLEFHIRPDYFGFAGFVYTVSDPWGATAKGKVEVYVSPVNDAPRAQDTTRWIRLEQTSIITVAQLMAQTYDIEGDAVSFVGLHLAANGSAATNGQAVLDAASGTIAFTPDALGDATLKYDVIDARGASATLTYKLKVRPLNDAPVARNDYGFRTLEDQILVIDPKTLLANDSDENGDTLIFEGVQRFPDNGKVRVNAAGMIEFSPRADYNGSAGFEYYISDGRGGTAKAYVAITVMPRNDGPVLRGDVVSGLEDKPLYVIPAEAFGNDIEPDGDVLFFKRASVLGVLEKSYLSSGVQISAKMADGTALPTWLSFDAGAISFSGTLPAGQEAVSVDVWVKDPQTGSNFNRRFSLDAEALAAGGSLRGDVLGGYTIREGWASNLEFGVATVADGTSVTATLVDGSMLPTWLTFDAETLTVRGTPPEGVVEPFDVLLTFTLPATAERGPVSHADRISIDPTQAAAVERGIAYDSDTALFDISKGSFSASLASGRPLPDWLAFDAETMTVSLTGFPPDANAPLARLQIIFTPEAEILPEKTYASTDRGFTLEFVIDPTEPLDPAINAILQNQPFFAAQGLFALDLGAATAISAARESRAPLPSWLSWNSETLTFSGMPPASYVGAVPVRLDVTGNGAGLPTMSVITEAVVDKTFQVTKVDGIGVSYGAERIDLTTPLDFNGAVAIAYDATDEKGGVSSRPATIVFNVQPTPEKPDGYGDEIDVRENESVTVALEDLLANDFDRDGDAIRVVEVQQPGNGAVTVNLSTVLIAPPAGLVPVEGGLWSAMLAGGTALPEWMSIDAATGEIRATVPLAVLAAYDIVVTQSHDGTSESASVHQAFDGNAGVTITYAPTGAFSGEDGFRYVITDDRPGNGSALVTVHVAPVADAPYTQPDRLDGIEDTPLLIDPALLLANDYDVDGDPIAFLGVLDAQHGTISYDGISILFTPDHNFDGRATFDYLVTDNVHGTSVGRVNVDVRSTNRAPIAAADVFETIEDTPFEFTIDQLLANDSDPDGDAFRFVWLSTEHPDGRIIELPGGRYQFVPDENVSGPKSFTYQITDGRRSTNGTLTFNVAAVNDAPIANPDGIFYGDQDVPFAIDLADLIANDRDVEGDAFTLVEVFDGDNGSVVRDGDKAIFTGRPGYYGDAGFSYRVTDVHGATSVGYVSLIVMPEFDLPIAVSDAGYEMLEDGFIDLDPAVLMANDYAPEGTTLAFVGFAGGAQLLDNGLYRVTPPPNFFGKIVLTYSINNGADFDVPTTVTIDVLPVSDAPFAGNDSLATVEDTPLTIFTSKLLANDGDVDLQAVVLTRVLGASGVSVVDNGIGQLVITPNKDFAGEAWFDYEIEDSSGIAARARVSVAVAAVNDAPTIGAIPMLVGAEDGAFSARLPADLVADVDGDALLVEVRGLGGAALPAWLSYDRRTQSLSGTPPLNFNGNVMIEVAAFDGQVETVRQAVVSIKPINDAPILAAPLADATSVEDRAIDITLPAGTFSDVDGDALNYSATLVDGEPLPSWLTFAGGRLTGTPPQDFHGVLDIRVVASDGALTASDDFRLTIDPANDAPVLVAALADRASPEDMAIDLALPAGTFADVDGDALTLTARLADGADLPSWLRFEGDRFIGTPPADFHGDLDIEVTASDGAASVSDIFRLSITAENDAPVTLLPLADAVSAEDQAFLVEIPAGSFGDVDGDALTLSARLADGTALPAWIRFESGRFTGTPPADFHGAVDIEVTASDGILAVSDTFRLTIDPRNDAPTLVLALDDRASAEDMPIDIVLPAGTFADVDGDALTLT